MYYVLLQVYYYSLEVFQLAGVSNGEIATIAVGAVLVAATFITVSTRVVTFLCIPVLYMYPLPHFSRLGTQGLYMLVV